jgi:hypothetical protein|tara:strand:- start:50 stop:514 length:465 start_codon:yes stop_codon:yes gene_type:complete
MGRSRSQGTANSNAIQLFGDRKDPEQLLWTAVLAKALDDAIYSSDYDEALNAISWIEGEGKDFRFVCGLAGRDSKYVVRKVLTKILERKKMIEDWKAKIKKKIENGMAKKNAILATKQKVGGTIGRRHKGGYHSGKRWGRKWNTRTQANTQTLQ